MAATPESSAASTLATQVRDPALASVGAKAPAFRVNPRKLDPLDEESDSDEESSDDDSDSSSGEEGIEVISADDSSNDEEGGAGDGSHRSQADRLRALQTASSAASPASAGSATPAPAAAASAKAASPEKATATTTAAAATHSSPSSNKDRDETTASAGSSGGSAAREGGVMDQCCIERCNKPHSNHVYNEAVGRMRDLPNSQRMCRAHYIEGLGQCCVKDCKNKATNRNLKKGASLPIKEGLPEHMLHKVCMEHWNLVDQQTRGGETRKRSRRKKKDDPSAGGAKSGGRGRKRRRNSSGDAEVEAFLASELGGKLSGESDSGDYSDDSDQEQHETRRPSSGPNEFYAVKSAGEGQARGEKRERVVSTLSEEDASSDDELDHQDAKRRRSMSAARDDINGAAPFPSSGGKSPFNRAMKGKAGGLAGRIGGGVQHGADRMEATAGGDSHKAKETSTAKSVGLDATAGADLKADVQQLRGEVAQLRSELKDLGRTMKEAMMSQVNSLKTECLALIGAKLTEAHEREMIQLRLLAAGRQRPPGAAQQAASSSSSSSSPVASARSTDQRGARPSAS